MSYILDALRRADSERERGTVPGLHTQGLPPLTGDEPAAPRSSLWLWALAVSGALVVAGLVWRLVQTDRTAAAQQVSAAPAAAPPLLQAGSAPASAMLTAPSPALTQPSRPEVVVVTVPTPAAPAPAPAPQRPALAAAPLPAPDVARQTAVVAAPPPGAAPPPMPSRNATNEAVPPPRILALHELPSEVRRAIPPLVVNGSVYSKNPADRFLIINGVIVHESDSVAPDVVLEAIGPRTAVLSTLGHRFEISY